MTPNSWLHRVNPFETEPGVETINTSTSPSQFLPKLAKDWCQLCMLPGMLAKVHFFSNWISGRRMWAESLILRKIKLTKRWCRFLLTLCTDLLLWFSSLYYRFICPFLLQIWIFFHWRMNSYDLPSGKVVRIRILLHWPLTGRKDAS